VRAYIRASEGDESTETGEALRWVCAGLEYLLGELLNASDGWHRWVDGVEPATDAIPDAVTIVSAVEMEVRGRADWGKAGKGPFWIEPLFSWIRISETDNKILSYIIRFGDSARGLGKIRYGKHVRRADWYYPDAWLFSFSKGIDTTSPSFLQTLADEGLAEHRRGETRPLDELIE